MLDRDRRKVIFDEIASDYDAIRPGYPDAVIDEIILLVAIPESGAILEIGCGSGQATRSFADRGYRMVCIDISPALLRIAAAKFSSHSNVAFRQTPFEEFEGDAATFDLIIAASSWHWVDPTIGYAKALSLLKPTGGLAVIATLPSKPLTGFLERVQEVYRELVPEWSDPNTSRPTASVIREAESEMKKHGFFKDVIPFEHHWEQEYSRDQYLRLLSTYSDHFLLGADRLERLFERMGRIIDEEYGGKLTRPYETVGYVGRK